jgi:hypothetical protein
MFGKSNKEKKTEKADPKKELDTLVTQLQQLGLETKGENPIAKLKGQVAQLKEKAENVKIDDPNRYRIIHYFKALENINLDKGATTENIIKAYNENLIKVHNEEKERRNKNLPYGGL